MRAHHLIVAIACLMLGSSAFARGGKIDPRTDVGLDQHLNEQVPLDLEFRDEQGQSVRLGHYFRERPVILVLVYHQCPMLCSLVLNGLLRSLRTLAFEPGHDFEIVTVSINPAETPQLARDKKNQWVKSYGRAGAEAGTHFLTGDEPAIKTLASRVGFRYAYDPETKEFAHASGIMVLTPQGKLSRYFYGVEFEARDLRLGLVEAANGTIGSAVEQILLLCFHYDPTTGKYGFAIVGALRGAGIVTLILLFGFIIRMLLRDRRRALAASRE
jgi:protein SCO1/2